MIVEFLRKPFGKRGYGIYCCNENFRQNPTRCCSSTVGIATGAFNAALKYSREREQFGQPISSFQAVQHMLADMAIQIEASRALVYQTCRHIDSGAKNISKNLQWQRL